MNSIDHAKNLAATGFYVFPIVADGKIPAVKAFTEKATCDASEVAALWLNRNNNIGIATSKFFGGEALLVVDVDNKGDKNGSDILLGLELAGHDFPKTLTQKTPTGGYHMIYKVKTAVKQGVNVLGDGLDIRSRGGYILGAGSQIKGKSYTIDNTPIADAPRWMIQRCKASVKKEARKKQPKIEVDQSAATMKGADYLKNSAPLAIEGQGGDQTTFIVASQLKDMGVAQDNCLDLLLDHWNERCEPPWIPDELEEKIENAFVHGQNAPGSDSPEADFDVIEDDETFDPVEELNERYSFIVIGGKSTILKHKKSGEVSYMNVQAFHDLEKSNVIIGPKGGVKQVSELWMGSDQRSTYESIELLPCQETPEGVYNLWRGFSCEPLEKGEDCTEEMAQGVRMFKEHALQNVCGGDEKLFNWLMGYFAHLVQRPWDKPLTALVFKGKKGVGKNALIDRIGHLFGCHYLLTANRRYLLSNFNKHLGNLILFTLDEAYWSGDKAAEGILKDLITGTTHLIEQKGREMYRMKNILRVCVIGNEDWVVPASEDERRFAVFNVGDKRRKDKVFFSTIERLIDKKGGNRLLLRELLDFDLVQVDVNDAPNTQGLLDQKIESLNPVYAWWHDSLVEGSIMNLPFSNEWPREIGVEQLREAFTVYIKQRGIRSWAPNASAFGKKLNQVIAGAETKRIRDGDTRKRVYILPSLEQCRALFDDFIGHKLKWEPLEPSNVIDARHVFS